jgi:iron complex outermembrane receptor protein
MQTNTLFHLKPLSQALLAAMALSASSLAWAEDTVNLNTVEVTGTQETSPAVVAEPTEDLLQTGNTETGALLRQLPGVNAVRKGGHGLDVMIHGQTASRINVLLDGANIQGGCPNRMDPPTSYAEIESFNEVKVLQGVQSLQYASGGTGGSVILSRKAPVANPDKPVSGSVSLLKSNVMNYDANADLTAAGQKGYVVLQATTKEANNYEDGNGDTVRSSYKTNQGHIDLGWTPNDNDHLKLSLEQSRTTDALYPGAAMDAPETEGNIQRLQYQRKRVAPNVKALNVEIYHTTVDHLMDNYSLRNNTGMKMKTPTHTETQGAKIQAASWAGQTRLDYGVQLQSINKDAMMKTATGIDKSAIWPDVTTSVNSAFVESHTPLSEKTKLTAGLRADWVHAKAGRANQVISGTTPSALYAREYANYSGKTSQDETNLNGLLRIETQLNPTVKGFAGISHTVRTADATERFVAKNAGARSWVGNPDLDPEQHNQIDLGLSQTTESFQWQANVWYDQVQDYILQDDAKNQTAATATDNRQIYVNVDAELYGATLQGLYSATDNLDLSGQLSTTQGRNTTDHRNLAMMPPVNGQLSAQYYANKWNAGARFNFALEQSNIDKDYTPEATHGKTPAWSTVDLFANYAINKTFSASAGVDNLFNQAYYSHLSYDPIDGSNLIHTNEPGRNLWAKVTAKF